MQSWGTLWTRYKDQDLSTPLLVATFEESGEKLGTMQAFCTQHHLKGGWTTKPPSSLTQAYTPNFTPCKE